MNETKKITVEEMINQLLEAYGENTGMYQLIRALAVYVLDPQHAFDVMAREQALRALRNEARYAGREVSE